MSDERVDCLAGFAAPLDPSGRAALYGPPPWRFYGHSLTVIAHCSADAVASLVPAPLAADGLPLVRFSVHELACDLGFGANFAVRHPERSRMHEAVVGLSVAHGDRVGFYDPFLWCDSDAEIAVGREMFGWPQVAGEIALTLPDSQVGRQSGDIVVGRVSRAGRPVMTLELVLGGRGELPPEVPAFATFFTMRVLPDPEGGPAIREVYVSDMEAPRTGERWVGRGALTLEAPELRPLAPFEVVAACCNTISWSKPRARRIARYGHAGAGVDR